MDLLAPEYKRDRRLSNESLRSFCNLIDLNDESECTKKLFSCSNCEEPLDMSDCKQLGLQWDYIKHLNDGNGLKRFKSLVMEGKVIGSLREYPVHNGEFHTLKSAKGVTSKVTNNRLIRASLKYTRKYLRTPWVRYI